MSTLLSPTWQQALQRLSECYLPRENVTAVDRGFLWRKGRRTNTPALRIHVARKKDSRELEPAQRFPTSFCGYPVDVIQGVYRGAMGEAETGWVGTIQPGISVSHYAQGAGTLGAIVYHKGRQCLLSAAHVLVDLDTDNTGDTIIQPGYEHQNSMVSNRIADLGGHALKQNLDAAFAILTGSRTVNPAQRLTDVHLQWARRPTMGDRLEKVGAVSGHTRAVWDGQGTYKVILEDVERPIQCFKLVPPEGADANGEISKAGDSGAVWYDGETEEGVGLHIAGDPADNTQPEYALACPLVDVLDALNLSLQAPAGPMV